MKSKIVQNPRGSSLVEFAIVLPLLIVLLFGVIEFSIILYDKAVITNAGREGARRGIVSQNPRVSDGEIASVVNNYCGNYLISFAGASPSTTVSRMGSSFGDDLTVRVTYNYTFLLLPKFVSLGNPIALGTTTVMKLE